MASANTWNKTRKVDEPYAIFTSPIMPGWEWRVLRAYQSPEGERANPYSRWFCAVRSPLTWGEFEYGDVYIRDIPHAVPGYREDNIA